MGRGSHPASHGSHEGSAAPGKGVVRGRLSQNPGPPRWDTRIRVPLYRGVPPPLDGASSPRLWCHRTLGTTTPAVASPTLALQKLLSEVGCAKEGGSGAGPPPLLFVRIPWGGGRGYPDPAPGWGHLRVVPKRRARGSRGAGETEAALSWDKPPAELRCLHPSLMGSAPKFQVNPSTCPSCFPFAEVITNRVISFCPQVTKFLRRLVT